MLRFEGRQYVLLRVLPFLSNLARNQLFSLPFPSSLFKIGGFFLFFSRKVGRKSIVHNTTEMLEALKSTTHNLGPTAEYGHGNLPRNRARANFRAASLTKRTGQRLLPRPQPMGR